jgi:flagellar protein FlgJ
MASFASAVLPGVVGNPSATMLEARVASNQGNQLNSEQADEVIQQFEAMFVRMMLKSMRSATRSLGDGLLSGSNTDSYLEMFDGQIADRLTAGRGIGIGDMLRTQLGLGGGAVTARRLLPPSPYAPVLASSATATSAVDAQRAPASPFADAADFVRSLLPKARETARQLGVSVRGLLAQMALETGWGRHVPPTRTGESSHNLFGIKAGRGWQGETTTLQTLELEDGVLQRRQARFRVYDDPGRSLEDYAALLQNNARYGEVLGSGDSVQRFATGLQAAGYATDPDYADKIQSIANGELKRLLEDLGETE